MPTAALTASGRKGIISAAVITPKHEARARHPFVFTSGAKVVQGERIEKKKRVFFFLYRAAACLREAEVVQGERIGKKKTRFFSFYTEPQPIFAKQR